MAQDAALAMTTALILSTPVMARSAISAQAAASTSTGLHEPCCAALELRPELPRCWRVHTNCASPMVMPSAGSAKPQRQPKRSANQPTSSGPIKAPRLMPM